MAESEADIEYSRSNGLVLSNASTIGNETTLYDLNDDCLFEVFDHLRQYDLANVADVCSRFRQIAQAHFARSPFKDSVFFDSCHHDRNYHKLLRNFGASIKKIKFDNTLRDFPKTYSKLIEQIEFYCRNNEALNEIVICSYH